MNDNLNNIDPTLIGYVSIIDDKPKIVVSPYLEPDFLEKVMLHESMHASLLQNCMPAFEVLSALSTGQNQEKIVRGRLANSVGEYGRTSANPILVDTIYSEFRFLNELSFPDGQKVIFQRLGSVICPVSRYPVDCFGVRGSTIQDAEKLFFHPYCQEWFPQAPSGYVHSPDTSDSANSLRISMSKMDKYCSEIEQIVRGEPTQAETWEEERSKTDDSFSRLGAVYGEFSLLTKDFASLNSHHMKCIQALAPWFSIHKFKWEISKNKINDAKATLKELAAKQIPESISDLEAFKKALRDCKSLLPRRSLLDIISFR